MVGELLSVAAKFAKAARCFSSADFYVVLAAKALR
jgi:hypothetical protein